MVQTAQTHDWNKEYVESFNSEWHGSLAIKAAVGLIAVTSMVCYEPNYFHAQTASFRTQTRMESQPSRNVRRAWPPATQERTLRPP